MILEPSHQGLYKIMWSLFCLFATNILFVCVLVLVLFNQAWKGNWLTSLSISKEYYIYQETDDIVFVRLHNTIINYVQLSEKNHSQKFI